MPLSSLIEIVSDVRAGVWDISETEDDLRGRLQWGNDDIAAYNSIKFPSKKIHWLSSRVLLRQMLNTDDFISLKADENGKPFLENHPEKISISHSAEKVAVIISTQKNVGVDIQKFSDRIHRIAHKFTSDVEWNVMNNSDRLIYIHLVWGAKEAMYKAYGKKQVDFIKNLYIDLPEILSESGELQGRFIKNSILINYRINYWILDSYILVSALEVS